MHNTRVDNASDFITYSIKPYRETKHFYFKALIPRALIEQRWEEYNHFRPVLCVAVCPAFPYFLLNMDHKKGTALLTHI